MGAPVVRSPVFFTVTEAVNVSSVLGSGRVRVSAVMTAMSGVGVSLRAIASTIASMPVTDAVMRWGPKKAPRVHSVWTSPAASEVPDVTLTEPWLVSGVKVTVTFAMGAAPASTTRATTGRGSSVPATVC